MWEPFADDVSIERIADAVQQAPSVFNVQPWSFRICAADRIELRANLGKRDGVDRGPWDRWLNADGAHHPDPLAREFVISCGTALYNLRLAIRVAGHDLTVWPLPNPRHDSTLLASVEIVSGRIKKPTLDEQELYQAIWQRHTNRWPYTIVPAPLPIIVAMEHAAAAEGAWLRLLNPHQAKKWMRVADKVDRYMESHPPSSSRDALYRQQRGRWAGRENSDFGVPSANFGPSPKNDRPHPRTRKDFWLRNVKRPFEHEPQLMALSTGDDGPLDWLRAGQALQYALLTGTRYSRSAPYGSATRYHPPHYPRMEHDELARYGLSVSFLTQPLERDDIDSVARRWPWRWEFSELPQMVMRVGYPAIPTPPAPRLPPDIIDERPSPRRSAESHVRTESPRPAEPSL
jgi:hypothetical protein